MDASTAAPKPSMMRAFQAAFPKTIPVLTGFLVLGIAYGMLMEDAGLSLIWTFLFSAVAFCGSMQFAAIPFLAAPFEPVQVFFLAMMVNARHLFYGLSMLKKYNNTGWRKFFLIYWMCDETFAINASGTVPEEIEPGRFYFATSFLDWSYWIIGGLIGHTVGSLITINTTGLDFALTALFLVLFLAQIQNRTTLISGIIGLLCGLISLLLFGPDNMIIPAMVLILMALLMGRKKICH